MNGVIDLFEFRKGLSRTHFGGDAESLWADLDQDGLGEVALGEVCEAEARLWDSFRTWCGSHFEGPRDMVFRLKYVCQERGGSQRGSLDQHGAELPLAHEEFARGLPMLEWESGAEDFLFEALDLDTDGQIHIGRLKWLEAEVRRHRRKHASKQRALRESLFKTAARMAGQALLRDFREFLRHTFGPMYHAWRHVLDNDGTMQLSRAGLFKVCRKLNWRGDVRALWKVLDFDGSGLTTIEELDPPCAQLLAQFKEWAGATFGAKPSVALWRALDRRDRRRLSHTQFVNECRELGFDKKVRTLAMWLDWQGKKYLTHEDLQILDVWRPPPWLIARPNEDAAKEWIGKMEQKYGHPLRAWRLAMDTDNSNCCTWHEFVHAAKTLKFHGDIPGAWLALDKGCGGPRPQVGPRKDLSGYITLKEIDCFAHDTLMHFKQWAVQEFGNIRLAFKAMDSDNSSELSFKEFKRAMYSYGYVGKYKILFQSLDQSGEKRVQYKEIAFLDEWELPALHQSRIGRDVTCNAAFGDDDQGSSATDPLRDQSSTASSGILLYQTKSPGPGTYNVLSGFAAMPRMPTAKHGGAFSFPSGQRQSKCPSARTADSSGPEPQVFSDAIQRRRKPAWSFGSDSRSTTPCQSHPASPGPGSYELNSGFHGPRFTMSFRQSMVLHPTQRVHGLPPTAPVSSRMHTYREE